MNYKEFTYQFKVKETDLDFYGHMNNATYVRIFEEARWDLINEGGYGLAEIMKTQRGPVVLAIDIKYKKEVKLLQNITIKSHVLGYATKVGQMKQVMYHEDGSVACEALFKFGFFDLKERKLIMPDKKWLIAIGQN